MIKYFLILICGCIVLGIVYQDEIKTELNEFTQHTTRTVQDSLNGTFDNFEDGVEATKSKIEDITQEFTDKAKTTRSKIDEATQDLKDKAEDAIGL